MEKQDKDNYKSCPGCGKLINWEAAICPYCNSPYPKIEFQEISGGLAHTVNSDKNFRTDTPKRPISIVLVVLLGIVFLTTILAFLFTPPNLLLPIIIYFPIFIIITFSLIFVNLKKIKSRSLGFLITTCALLAILIISSVSFSNMQKKKNIAGVTSKSAEEAKIAASGTTINYKIAFMSERDGNREIYIMNTDKPEQVINLTNNPAADWLPTFSPDGSKIAFTSDRSGNNEIYIMNIDGSELKNLTNSPADDWQAAFSPDGSKIAFTSDRDGKNYEIYIMNVDGSDQVRLTDNPAYDGAASFSPDGTKIAFHSRRDGDFEIYTMNVDGSKQVRLTNSRTYDWYPVFSPDGAKIAFESRRDRNEEIYIMNVDGSEQVNLTNNRAVDYAPSFSHDGAKIAFNSTRDGNAEIYIMNVDGSGLIRLTNNPANDNGPSFSPLP